MNKKVKKIISYMVVTLMLFSMSITAFADNDEEIKVVDEEYLNSWINDFVVQYGLNTSPASFSVGFCYTATNEMWFYNADEFMYSASMYKVPVCMLLAEKEAAGEITQESLINGMTVKYLESSSIVQSNNDSGHYVADYVGEGVSKYNTYNGKCADMVTKYAPSISGDYYTSDFYDWSYYSARFITEAIKTLYEGGEEKFPHIIEYMKQAMPINYFHLKQEGGYEIAQKYGDYIEPDDTKDHHCTGIIYTPTPIVVTVMSKNIESYEYRIADVAKFLTDYSLELDKKYEALKPTPTPEPTATPEEVMPTTEVTTNVQNPANRPMEKDISLGTIIIPGIIFVAGVLFITIIKKSTKNKNAKEWHDGSYESPNQIKMTKKEKTPKSSSKNKKGKYVPKH